MCIYTVYQHGLTCPMFIFSMNLMGSDLTAWFVAGCLGLVVWRWPIWIPLQIVPYSICWGLFITSRITSFRHTNWFYLEKTFSQPPKVPALNFQSLLLHCLHQHFSPLLLHLNWSHFGNQTSSSHDAGHLILQLRFMVSRQLFGKTLSAINASAGRAWGGFFGSLVEVMHGWMSFKGLSLRKLVEKEKN